MSRDLSIYAGGDPTDREACRQRTRDLQAILDEDGELIFPAGHFHLSEGDVRWRGLILRDGAYIRGRGLGTVLHFWPLTDDPEAPYRLLRGISVPEVFEPFQGADIAEISVEMHNARALKEQGHAIFLSHCRVVRIRDVNILSSPDGDGIYLGTDTSYVWVENVLGRDCARCTVTIEGSSQSADRNAIYVSGCAQEFTEASNPTQRLGRVVDCETDGRTEYAVRGLRIIGNYGVGGIELATVRGAVVLGNIAERVHAVSVKRVAIVGNVLHATRRKAGITLQRLITGFVGSNWIQRPITPPGLTFGSDDLRWTPWEYAVMLRNSHGVPTPPREAVDATTTLGELYAAYEAAGNGTPTRLQWEAVFGPPAVQVEQFAGSDVSVGRNRVWPGGVSLHVETGRSVEQDDADAPEVP